jgi:serine/threonine-protein kinase
LLAHKPERTKDPARAWGPYVLGRRIGRGGMGVVHAAVQRGIGGIARLVAVKILLADRADDGAERAAFLREARILARLDHPNVVRWLDAGEVDGDVFIAMELLHGASLAQIAAASPERLPLPVAVAILAELARGLHAAHELRDEAGSPLGLVHQDVSPQNAVVGYDGRTRLVDFGIARLASVDASRTDTVRGKPAYLAPEQLEGRRLDRRTDVFALGVVAFEVLSGRRLFARSSIAETHTAVLFEPIPDLGAVVPGASADLAAVVACALARPPDGRFRTAEAFRRALVEARDAAGIPIADEREIAALVASRVPPPWQPHELFAEIDVEAAWSAAPPADELSQAATVAPKRENGAAAIELSQAATVAPKRENGATAIDVSQVATVAPTRDRNAPAVGDASAEATVAPRRAAGAPVVESPSEPPGVAPQREAIVERPIPANTADQPDSALARSHHHLEARAISPPARGEALTPAGPPATAELPGQQPPDDPIDRPPMSRTPWWVRGAVLVAAVGLVAAAGLVRSAVRSPAENDAPGQASVAPSGQIAPEATAALQEPGLSTSAPSAHPAGARSAGAARASSGAAVGPSALPSPGFSSSPLASSPLASSPLASSPLPSSATLPAASAADSRPSAAPPTATSAADTPPVSTTGWISVWSTPWGHVRIDGREVGDSPAVRIAVSPGSHSVSVKSDAGEQARGVMVKAGEESKVRFVF